VTPQIHLVVQNSADFYDLPLGDPVEEEVTSAPTVPGDVKRTEARHDVVARLRADQIGTVRKLADRPNQRIAIGFGTVARRSFSAVHVRMFAKSSSATAPRLRRHLASLM
jgi:hypothetical protein